MKLRMMTAGAILSLCLAACGDNDRSQTEVDAEADTQQRDNDFTALNYREGATDDFDAPEYMQLEVTLDSLGFSPGVIDGKMDIGTKNALIGYQEANDLTVSGEYDEATRTSLSGKLISSATRRIQVPAFWAEQNYEPVPDAAAAQAKMDRLAYGSIWERLGERFHTTPEVLYALNPNLCRTPQQAGTGPAEIADRSADDTYAVPATNGCAYSGSLAGQDIRVPNIVDGPIDRAEVDNERWADTLVSLGITQDQPKAAKIVVDKSEGMLRAFDEQDRLIAAYTVTSGSKNDPLPLGEWKINGIGYNPDFAYDPDLFWDVPDSNPDLELPPGPNGPVGVVWIDLSKEHYGIHGTNSPETIGTAQSHGCVRLTNWDAAELAQRVGQSTEVLFQA